VAEVAYLSLQEAGLKLVAVMDDERQGGRFFGLPIVTLAEGVLNVQTPVVISSLKRREALLKILEAGNLAANCVLVAGSTVEKDVKSAASRDTWPNG